MKLRPDGSVESVTAKRSTFAPPATVIVKASLVRDEKSIPVLP